MAEYTSNGGGATHIAKVTGQLKDLSSNLSDILMVSGGGGGGYLLGEDAYSGKDAGGISGSGDNSGNQSTGYGFGQGETGTDVSGGGSGLYGGYKGTSSKGGGAGSGYIGNSLLSSKKMVGYNVPTSSDAGTKTESVNIYSETRIAEVPKVGDGWARIKLLQAVNDNLLEWRTLTKDKNHYKFAGYNKSVNELSDYFGSDWILYAGQSNYNKLSYYDGAIGTGTDKIAETGVHIYIPIRPIVATKIRFKAKMNTGGSYAFIFMNLGYIENNQMQQVWSDKTVGTYGREWVELTKMLDTPKEVQYVIVEACDYVYNFKDFEFNYE